MFLLPWLLLPFTALPNNELVQYETGAELIAHGRVDLKSKRLSGGEDCGGGIFVVKAAELIED